MWLDSKAVNCPQKWGNFIFTTLALPGKSLTINKIPPSDDSSFDETLPPIIHLILDEHIGIEGIPTSVDNGTAVRNELEQFYDNRGFRLFGRAFSQYYDTNDSISSLLNFSTIPSADVSSDYKEFDYVLTQNAYFQLLSNRGYRIRVYQSTFMDFCRAGDANLVSCFTYPANSIKGIETMGLEELEKAKVILASFLDGAITIRYARKAYIKIRNALGRYLTLPAWHRLPGLVGPVLIPGVLERVGRDVSSNPRGTVFFAHLLIPHYPYTFDGRCEPYEDSSEWLRRMPTDGSPNDSASWKIRYVRYLEQIRCQQRWLGSLFDTFASKVFDDAIIIVHGDHGSRIQNQMFEPTYEQRHRWTTRDYVDGFSTLFAVKRPDQVPGYNGELAPIRELLAGAIGIRVTRPPRPIVYLRDEKGMTEVPMVPF